VLLLARASALRPFSAEDFFFAADRLFPPTEPCFLKKLKTSGGNLTGIVSPELKGA
jgi:hypothetical protein